MPSKVKRLHDQLQPTNYALTYSLDPSSPQFSGSVTIQAVRKGRPSKRITLHQKGLKITEAHIIYHDKKGVDKAVVVTRVNSHKSYDEVRLHTDALLYPGKYTISCQFESIITDSMTGIYFCTFTDAGQDKKLIATQFESHHAREAFPCIDEPEAKATFDITLHTPDDLTVLSNTPVAASTKNGTTVSTTFEQTPRMSTYLLAFVVGEMHRKTSQTKTGIEVSVWATKAQPLNSVDFALDVAVRSIEFFEDYFGVPYPLAKADHVALPDFSSGAMENWGLITYRERVLLAYPGDTSQSTLEQIATVVTHETSHQWFGNLVTMRWWDDLWLNESFANMMEYQAVDAIFPQWHIWDSFVAMEGLSALRRDATPGVQAVRTSVNHPDEISTLFDPSIVYAKGGRLLYMMKHYIGEEAFRSGLTAYFKEHAYKNTTGDDLWKSLSKASGKDVGAFMTPWLERSGFPVVSVTQDNTQVTIAQEHFSDDPTKADPTRLWPTPLFAASSELPELLTTATQTVTVSADETVLINQGASGHYIVNYITPTQRAFIVQKIKAGDLSNAERLMLLNDSSMLARAGYQSYGDVLQLMEAYRDESSDPVWDILSVILGESRRFIDLDTTLEDAIKAYSRKLITKQYARLGWEGAADESAADQKLRATIIGLGTYADEPTIIDRAQALFTAYKKDPTVVSSELRGIVLGVPIKTGDTKAFNYLLDLHDKSNNSDLKADVCGALCATRSKEHASLLLNRIKNPKLVKAQDADRWLVYLMRNRYVREIAWDWMVHEWDWIEQTYKADKSYDNMPRYAAGGCNTKEWATKYKTFFEPKLDQIALKRNILIGMEEITNRVNWLERDIAAVQAFFKAT